MLGTNAQKLRKFAEKNTGKILAHKYLAVDLMVKYGVKLGHGVSVTNYAHEVWQKHGQNVPKDKVKQYHKDIEGYIHMVKTSVEYQLLLNGTASPQLIVDTHIRYAYVKKCGG